MGIKNFYKFINFNCPEAIEYISKNDLYNKKIGIDGNFWMYQIMASMKTNNIKIFNYQNNDITHIYGLYIRIISILKIGIKPLFVFDGKCPDLKLNTIRKRIDEKNISRKKIEENNFENDKQKKKLLENSFFISKKEIEDCKKLLFYMNIPFIQSFEEADSQLAYLSKNHFIDYVISNDTDILIFGSKNILPFFKSSNDIYKLINMETIKKKFNLTENDIIKLAIILGNDYNKSLQIDSSLSIKSILDYKIESNYNDVINYYKYPLIIEKHNLPYLQFNNRLKSINIRKHPL